MRILGWRDVPTDPTGLGKTVLETMPLIRQAIVVPIAPFADQDAFERKMLVDPQADAEQPRPSGGGATPAGLDRVLHAVLLDPHGGL